MRINGSFYYALPLEDQRDPSTGFITEAGDLEWLPGCECQIDKSIPARRKVGSDGQTEAIYSYDVFIPKHFTGELMEGGMMRLICHDAIEAEFEILGIDNLNRKYIEVWG